MTSAGLFRVSDGSALVRNSHPVVIKTGAASGLKFDDTGTEIALYTPIAPYCDWLKQITQTAFKCEEEE